MTRLELCAYIQIAVLWWRNATVNLWMPWRTTPFHTELSDSMHSSITVCDTTFCTLTGCPERCRSPPVARSNSPRLPLAHCGVSPLQYHYFNVLHAVLVKPHSFWMPLDLQLSLLSHCFNQGPHFDKMSSFFPCEIDDAIQYINLGYVVQAPKIVIL